jgi:hypothetical protein
VKRLVLVGALIGLTVMACGKNTPASTDPVHSENTTPVVVPVKPTSTTVVLGDTSTWSNLTDEQVQFVEELTKDTVSKDDPYSDWCEVREIYTYFCIKYDCWDWDSFNKACAVEGALHGGN